MRRWRPGDVIRPATRAVLLAGYLLIVGCGGASESDITAETASSAIPGVFTGTFPCLNCPGIATSLWLRSDGRYFISQQYLADDPGDEMLAYGLGRWRATEGARTIVLTGDGPPRTFAWPEPDVLLMRTDSALEHRLTRNPQSPDFTASIRMAGMMHKQGGGAVFEECLTGLEAPVRAGGDYARFSHQYRGVAAGGERVLVELEGRFSWLPGGAPEALTIDRFVTIRERGACRSTD